MSKRSVRLSSDAEEDIRDLLRNTAAMWGEDLRDEYARFLDEALERLIHFPNLGRVVRDSFRELRMLPVQEHVVFYVVTDTQIRVMRVLHKRMDTSSSHIATET